MIKNSKGWSLEEIIWISYIYTMHTHISKPEIEYKWILRKTQGINPN